jgi:hypothetical protein
MRDGFFFFVLAGLLGAGSACIIVTDDEGTGNDTANDTANATTSDGTTGGTMAATEPGSSTAQTGAEVTTAADVTTGADETAAGGACGWGPTGDPEVPNGYVCGGQGEDPDGNFSMLCPEGVELVEGGACGSIEGPGCCDANGNAWFCGDDGNGPVLVLTEC